VPVFICPGCGAREAAAERTVGHQPRGCPRCGFGFQFELLDDYYPGPRTALLVCDRDGRVIAAGLSTVAITGFREGELLGHKLVERLSIKDFPGDDPTARAIEWGVRVLAVPCTFAPNGVKTPRPATLDCFPAYDDDGGLLVALTAK
jgi:hypothetical protein